MHTRPLDDVVRFARESPVANRGREADPAIVAEYPARWAEGSDHLVSTPTQAQMGDNVMRTADVQHAALERRRQQFDESMINAMHVAHATSPAIVLSLTG